jgi:hypothetical protein
LNGGQIALLLELESHLADADPREYERIRGEVLLRLIELRRRMAP